MIPVNHAGTFEFDVYADSLNELSTNANERIADLIGGDGEVILERFHVTRSAFGSKKFKAAIEISWEAQA